MHIHLRQLYNPKKGGDGGGNDNGHHSFKSHIFDYILNVAIKVVENNAINLPCTTRNDKMFNRIACYSTLFVEMCDVMHAKCWKSCIHDA